MVVRGRGVAERPNGEARDGCAHGRGAVLTNNKGFEEWGEISGDEVVAAALVDRLKWSGGADRPGPLLRRRREHPCSQGRSRGEGKKQDSRQAYRLNRTGLPETCLLEWRQ